MSSLVLPNWVRSNMERELLVDSTLEAIPYWNRLLRELDEKLSLVWVNENAPARPGFVPGRWHVRRDNREHGAPDTYKAVVDKDGSYRPMGSDIIEELRRHNLWNDQVAQQIWREKEEAARAKEHADELETEQRQYELASAIKAKVAPGILISPDVKWSNSPAGKRGRK